MTISFAILAIITIAASVAAMSLRNLIHCALAMVGAFGGLAALYLQLDAQFVGFTQILVYIGAVAILIVFAILLTRGGQVPEKALFSSSWIWGLVVTVAVFGTLAWTIKNSFAGQREPAEQVEATVKQTPSPSSTANQRLTPTKLENGPDCTTSATEARHCQATESGQASSSRVVPPPLRQGVGTTSFK